MRCCARFPTCTARRSTRCCSVRWVGCCRGGPGGTGSGSRWRATAGAPRAACDDLRAYLRGGGCTLEHGELELAREHATEVHEEATLRRLAEDTIRVLRELDARCAEPGAGGRAPSDFPLAHLDR